jgi:serine/threonine-protein kinase
MLTEAEKHAATMAMSRFGADRSKIQAAIDAVMQAQHKGQRTDLLEVLVAEKLLTPGQANEVRFSLDKTQIDPSSPKQATVVPSALQLQLEADGPIAGLGEDAPPDLRVLGDFRILRRLGEGGMGAVYLAYHQAEDRQVAIKVLPKGLASNQASRDRFYREYKSGILLNHPNIVRNITAGQDGATSFDYLVLEYVDGPSAQTLLEQMGTLPVGDAVHIVLDIARALEHAHSRNVVHRDIKPANILITRSGVAKLSDLGLAKRTDEASHLTAARQGFGTPYYMPYEQAMNAKYADARSDIYALGATLYHLVTGEVPFPGINHLEIVDKKNVGIFAPASSRNAKVPTQLDKVLDKMLARDPKERYQTASELIVDLERSGLAAQVPSFVDRDLALQDPLVRQRLTSPAQPTCPDLQMHRESANGSAAQPEFWYLRYRDRQGQLCKAKRTAEQICQRVRDGKLPPTAEASRLPQGSFRPLGHYAEFKKLVATKKNRKLRNGTPPRDSQVFTPEVSDRSLLSSKNLWLLLGTAGTLAAAAVFWYTLLLGG